MSITASHPIQASSVTRALDIIGDRWMLLILRDAFLGVRRFEQWQQHLGIARRLLADRLKRLVASGLLVRVPYQAHQLRHNYHLTPMGQDLYALALMIRRWERQWVAATAVGGISLVHRTCGSRTEPQCVCMHCGQMVTAQQTSFEDCPGVGREPQGQPRRQRRSSVTSIQAPNRSPFLQDAIDILGDRWTYLVLAAAFYRIRRFTAFRQALGIATNILADRLRRLVEAQILTHTPVQERSHVYEYSLTEKGLDLFPVIVAVLQWGDRWLAGPHGPSLILRHQRCGRGLQPSVICDVCGAPLCSSDVDYRLPPRHSRSATISVRSHQA
ncbi:MAG TPA: helix-turn-helix domain-containing protein [Candidatus Binatia bacterium]|nr:helix-turn-helix domain-containing protein [Candidatus Binatia bacterium]